MLELLWEEIPKYKVRDWRGERVAMLRTMLETRPEAVIWESV